MGIIIFRLFGFCKVFHCNLYFDLADINIYNIWIWFIVEDENYIHVYGNFSHCSTKCSLYIEDMNINKSGFESFLYTFKIKK